MKYFNFLSERMEILVMHTDLEFKKKFKILMNPLTLIFVNYKVYLQA